MFGRRQLPVEEKVRSKRPVGISVVQVAFKRAGLIYLTTLVIASR